MARCLPELPPEILQIIINELSAQHHSLIVPLAQTYNRVIYAACSEILKHRRAIPAAQRVICDIFHEEYRPGWSRVWGDTPLDLSYLDLCGTLHWLDALACDIRDYDSLGEDQDDDGPVYIGVDDSDDDSPAILRLSSQFRSTLEDLVLQTEAVGCQLPYAFVKFFKRFYYYEDLFHILRNDFRQALEPHLHKVHPQDGLTGYLVDFLYDRHGGTVLCLYLDPGPLKSHALVWTYGCGFDDGCDMEDGNGYRKVFEIKDTNGKIHKGCHDFRDSDLTFMCFDFEAWLAGIMCYYACLYDVDDWEREHPSGSLRRTRFLECVAANPELRYETWSQGAGEEIRALFSKDTMISSA